MHSHSGGPPGTCSYHSLLVFACSILRHVGRPLLALVISRGSHCRSFRLRGLSTHILLAVPVTFTTPRLNHVACRPLESTPTDFGLVHSLIHSSRGLLSMHSIGLPRTFDASSSQKHSTFRTLVVSSRGFLVHSIGLPRTVLVH
jgi:hypothetical protein